MALQSSFYPVDGRSKTYPQTKHVASKQHGAVYSRLLGTLTWNRLSNDGWSLINNSIVLLDPFSPTVYDQIEIRIADEANELTDSISDISIVASLNTEIASIVADKATLDSLYADKATLDSLFADKIKLDSLYADKVTLDSLYADKATLDSLYADKATLDSLFADKATLDSLYADKIKLDSLYADKATLDSLYADKATLDSLYADKIGLDAIYTNLAEILLADDNATAAAASATSASNSASSASSSASSAQLRAWEAEAEKMTADSYAGEAEDTFVNIWTSDGDGTFTATPTTEYSSLHWAAKSALDGDKVLKAGDTMTGNLEAPSMSIGGKTVVPYKDDFLGDIDTLVGKSNIGIYGMVAATTTSTVGLPIDQSGVATAGNGTMTITYEADGDITIQTIHFSNGSNFMARRMKVSTDPWQDWAYYGSLTGNNANGEYIQYADGTLVCKGSKTYTSIDIAGASGALFRNTAAGFPAVTYPKSFVGENPSVNINQKSGTLVAHVATLTWYEGINSFTPVFFTTESLTNTTLTITFAAIGRWRA